MNGHGGNNRAREARNANGGVVFREERDQEEYLFVHERRADGPQQRPTSQASADSQSASINFLTDDREATRGNTRRWEGQELFARDSAQIRVTEQPQQVPRRRPPMGEVDYSPNNFRQARAAIQDAATRQQMDGPPERMARRRVRQFGDTTVITEHRDPYSFYWQLDRLKRAEEDPRRPLPPADYVLEEEEEEESAPKDYLSPDSGVHVERDPPSEESHHYARPMKEWERAGDPSTFSHYWHVDSGQRPKQPPPPSKQPSPPPRADSPPPPFAQPISISNATQTPVPPPDEPLIEEHAFRQTTTKRRVEVAEEESEEGSPIEIARYLVRPLGHSELSETDLESVERSQWAINGAMARLGSHIGAGDGANELILEIGGGELRLLEPRSSEDREEEVTVLRRVPLEQIRVWGVGRDSAREFAYVAKELNGTLLCHVFRCDTPAKNIANTLHNACDVLLRLRPDSLGSGSSTGRRRRMRHSLPLAPIEEPKRIVRCHFIGVTQVPRATGIEVLNEAVDRLVADVGTEGWTVVDVHISPSAIGIYETGGAQRQIASCRVRYLSFLGVGRDVKHCAFIVAQSSDHFVCYVFHANPSASSLAKTIESACKLRYQKVLDAHLGRLSNGTNARLYYILAERASD